MRIKLDENISAELAPLLQVLGHAVDTVADEGLTGALDADVWAAAQNEGRMLVTQNLDFSDTRRFGPGTHHGILLLRLAQPGLKAQMQYMEALLQEHDIDAWHGCHVTASDHKLRIKKPAA